MQAEALKRDAIESRMQEQMDTLAKTLASIQLQLSNIDKGKTSIQEESILGHR